MADDTRVTHRCPRLACALALFVAIGCGLPAAARAADIIVQREAGLTPTERADIRSDADVTLARMLPLPNAEVVTVSADRARHALAALNADADVRYAAPDVPVHAAAAAAPDPYLGLQWALDNPGPSAGYPTAIADSDIDATDAWSSATGQGIVVAVADMSIDVTHPDLQRNIQAGGVDEVQAGGCAAGLPTGAADHGTHVAGIVAAERDNGIGIAGVAPAAGILPVRALDNCGAGRLSWVLSAFAQAADNPAVRIVTASFATDPWLSAAEGADVRAAFVDLIGRYPDTLFVVPAGNEGNDDDARPVYPCSTPADNLICVGTSDTQDAPTCWGNVGERSVDLFAPGVGIYSTVRGFPGYTQLSGTSMSAPMVAGAAALVMQRDPEFGPLDVKRKLVGSVDPKVGMGGTAPNLHGRLNAARAFDARTPKGGGPGRPWVSCDRDHDGVRDDVATSDACPDAPAPGTVDGCPDTDADGVRDFADNCASVPNPNQADADGDSLGDACDPTPRGADLDGDAKAALDDRCPMQPAPTADGCPAAVSPLAATPTRVAGARIVSLGVKVRPSRCARGSACRRSARVTVKLSRTATVKLTVERRVRTHGRWTWRRVTVRSIVATASGRSLTVRGTRGRSLSRGPYRVTAKLAGARTAARSFRV